MFISSDDSVANRIDDLLAGENETAKAFSEPSPRWMIQIGRPLKNN